MPILTRLLPTETELLYLSIGTICAGDREIKKLVRRRERVRVLYWLADIALGVSMGFLLVMLERLSVEAPGDPWWLWLLSVGLFILSSCAFFIVFHVERSYRKVGL